MPALIWLAVLTLLGAALWLGANRLWRTIRDRPEFALSPSGFTSLRGPRCVRHDVMMEELRRELSVVLEGATVFDKDLCYRVQRELRASPWVLDVESVRRLLPNKLQVEVIFREPAALLELGAGRHMVDRDGYCLPDSLYRRPASLQGVRTPVIVNRALSGPPPRRRRWHVSLAVGARLCEFLLQEGLFDELPVSRIDVTNVGRGGSQPDIVLLTEDGVAIKWGRSDAYAYLKDLPGAAPANSDRQKLQMLRSKLADYPALKGLEYIDLQFNAKIFFSRAVTVR